MVISARSRRGTSYFEYYRSATRFGGFYGFQVPDEDFEKGVLQNALKLVPGTTQERFQSKWSASHGN